MKPPLSYYPLLIPTASFIVGIILGSGTWWLIALGIAFAIGIVAVALKRIYLSTIPLMICIGIVAAKLSTPNDSAHNYAGRQLYYLCDIDRITVSDRSQSMIVTIDKCGTDPENLHPIKPLKAALTLLDFKTELSKGEQITIEATFKEIKSQHDLPHETNYSDYLISQGITLQAFIISKNIVDCIAPKGLAGKLYEIRDYCERNILQSKLSDGAKEFLATTLSGDKSVMSGDTRKAFSDSGLAHVLALSGLHVGIITMILSIALWPLMVTRRKVYSLVIIAILWCYAIATGLSPSVVRAVIMASVYMIGTMLERTRVSLNSLCLAALVILIFSPQSLFDIGFQLSFAAVAAIILFARPLNPFPERRRIPYLIASYICVSLSAMIGTGIISALYFHKLPLYFLLANCLSSLILPPLLGLGILVMILNMIGISITALCSLVDLLYTAIEWIANTTASLPGAVIDKVYISPVAAVAFISTLILIAIRNATSSRKATYAAIASGIATIILLAIPTPRDQQALYVGRHAYRTDFIFHTSRPTLDIFSTDSRQPIMIADETSRLYGEFMVRNSLDSINILHNNCRSANFEIRDNVIRFGTHKIAIVDQMRPTLQGSDYAIVCRGFMGDIVDLYNQLRPDTLVISSDINSRRAARYLQECSEAGIPTISLRDRSLLIR